jgi:DHA2 family multidrug resistance protein
MHEQSVFKSWMPDWAIKVVLIFCMLHSMVLLGLYTSNLTYAASFLDVEVEDLQYAMSVTYGTFLSTILIESRIFRYFPTRNYFIAIYFLAAITFIVSAHTHHFVPFIIIRVLEGVLMALPWIPLRVLLLTRFKSKNATIIVFSFTYGALLIASPFIVNIVVWLLEHYDWKYMTYSSAIFQFICVALVLITFNGQRFYKKTPLYQVDWASFVLVHAAILCGAYVLTYGEKKYWFESMQIVMAAIATIVTALLFLMRQFASKRPCFDLSVLRYANLRTGFVLFILFYISRASLNICHTTMSTVWNWEPLRVAHVQYLNAFGNVIGIFASAILLSRAVATRYIFILGFSLMAFFHLWFTFLFVPEIDLWDIAAPYILQGIAVGILFVPLVLFTVSAVPTRLAPFSGAVGVGGRFWGSTIGFCLMRNAQIFFEQNHISKFKQFAIAETEETRQQFEAAAATFLNHGFTADEASILALKQISVRIKNQAVLLANMEIFTATGIGLVVLVVLLLFNKHMKLSFDLFRNKNWGS